MCEVFRPDWKLKGGVVPAQGGLRRGGANRKFQGPDLLTNAVPEHSAAASSSFKERFCPRLDVCRNTENGTVRISGWMCFIIGLLLHLADTLWMKGGLCCFSSFFRALTGGVCFCWTCSHTRLGIRVLSWS